MSPAPGAVVPSLNRFAHFRESSKPGPGDIGRAWVTGGLEQGVPAFADGADRVVGLVELALHVGARPIFRFLVCDGDRVGFPFVAEIAGDPQVIVGPRGWQRQDAVLAQGGGVVFPAGTHR
jgi:hypothetical protein